MKSRIPFLFFLITLLIGLIFLSLPKYNVLVSKEREFKNKNLELQNLSESIISLRDTLKKISERRKLIFQERNLLFLTKDQIPIFFKELSETVNKYKLKSFELRPGDFEDLTDLPENFPLKIKKLSINLKFAGTYNQYIDFFRDVYNKQFPIGFRELHFINDMNSNLLILHSLFDVYVLEGGGE